MGIGMVWEVTCTVLNGADDLSRYAVNGNRRSQDANTSRAPVNVNENTGTAKAVPVLLYYVY